MDIGCPQPVETEARHEDQGPDITLMIPTRLLFTHKRGMTLKLIKNLFHLISNFFTFCVHFLLM